MDELGDKTARRDPDSRDWHFFTVAVASQEPLFLPPILSSSADHVFFVVEVGISRVHLTSLKAVKKWREREWAWSAASGWIILVSRTL